MVAIVREDRTMGPLNGIRIVEIASLGPGPFCAMMLADMGAEVLRIERKDSGGSALKRNPRFNVLNRGRVTLALDIKDVDDRTILGKLIARADGLLEGFRPGVMERLGYGPDDCQAMNPRLVYGRMTGWGQEGPMAETAGHDINYLALSGTLSMIGTRQEPVIPLNLLGDFGGGGLYLAFGIVCALLEAKTSRQGQVVDAAMIDGVASLSTFIHGLRAAGQWRDERQANFVDGGAPFYAIYETADQRHMAVGAIEKKFFAEFLTGLGTKQFSADDQWNRELWPDMKAHFTETFAQQSRDAWCFVFDGKDACVTPVLTADEAMEHAHLKQRSTFMEKNDVMQPAPAPRLSRTPGAIRPMRKADLALLDGWGLSEEEIKHVQD